MTGGTARGKREELAANANKTTERNHNNGHWLELTYSKPHGVAELRDDNARLTIDN